MNSPPPPPATARLQLRAWTPADRVPFAALNADPEVMLHFPAPLTRAESDALAERLAAQVEHSGWGLWAAEVTEGADAGRFAGFIGLSPVPDEMPFAPAIEVGWRLARWAWGRGYATEGGRAALAYAFDRLGVDEVVSFTAVVNPRSIAVMERLGMTRDPAADFEHPLIVPGHRLRPHVLYRTATSPQTETSGGRSRA